MFLECLGTKNSQCAFKFVSFYIYIKMGYCPQIAELHIHEPSSMLFLKAFSSKRRIFLPIQTQSLLRTAFLLHFFIKTIHLSHNGPQPSSISNQMCRFPLVLGISGPLESRNTLRQTHTGLVSGVGFNQI